METLGGRQQTEHESTDLVSYLTGGQSTRIWDHFVFALCVGKRRSRNPPLPPDEGERNAGGREGTGEWSRSSLVGPSDSDGTQSLVCHEAVRCVVWLFYLAWTDL